MVLPWLAMRVQVYTRHGSECTRYGYTGSVLRLGSQQGTSHWTGSSLGRINSATAWAVSMIRCQVGASGTVVVVTGGRSVSIGVAAPLAPISVLVLLVSVSVTTALLVLIPVAPVSGREAVTNTS